MKVQVAAFYGVIFSGICAFSEGFMGISGSLFVLLFIIMITDYITGLQASKKEGQKFISKRGLQWVFKFGSYMVFLAVSFVLRRELLLDHLDIFEVPFKLMHFYVLIHIFWWELKSVDENFERLGYSFRVLKLAERLFKFLKDLFKKKLEEESGK